MKKQEELVIITKTYDLILWSCNHTGRFPRQHRFVLGERLERTLYDLLETLIRAKYSRERTPLLNEANLKLEILRFQIRLAKDLLRTSLDPGTPRYSRRRTGPQSCSCGLIHFDA